ncbi:MAG TPA: hypothetical protein VHY80_20310 [Stellaceae bacterium]|jgi:hypothetical protein|nr:hypothetical protein [Stellaceae bacterium]
MSGETETLWVFLDLMIDGSALIFDIDLEIASFAMMAALVAAERLGISDDAAYRLRDSALAEKRNSGTARRA